MRVFKLIAYFFQFAYHRSIARTGYHHDVIREAVEDLGGVYIKLVQFLSLRSDIFPEKERLRYLHFYDAVPAEHMQVQKIIKRSLGQEASMQFTHIEKEPFASGTFGQVYKATLTDGALVVIKIKRSRLYFNLLFDFWLIRIASSLVTFFYHEPVLNIRKLLREFQTITFKELDYHQEVRNARFLYDAYRNHDVVKIPYTYNHLSTSRFIVQEYIGGIAMTELIRMKSEGKDYRSWLQTHYKTDIRYIMHRTSFDTQWQALKLDKFYADPHPGNIKVLPNNQYAFIDFGIMEPTPAHKRSYFEIIKRFADGVGDMDASTLSRELLTFGAHELYGSLKTFDAIAPMLGEKRRIRQRVERKYERLIEENKIELKRLEKRLGEDFGRVWYELFQLGERFQMEPPEGIFAVLRTAALISMFGRALEPDYRFTKNVYKDLVEHIDGHNLTDYASQDHKEIPIERAVEYVSEWLSALAEKDLGLYYHFAST